MLSNLQKDADTYKPGLTVSEQLRVRRPRHLQRHCVIKQLQSDIAQPEVRAHGNRRQ